MAAPTRRTAPKPPPCFVCNWDIKHAGALQALDSGQDVPPHLAKLALDWIIQEAGMAYGQSFDPASDRNTAFAEGRRFVGNKILTLLRLNLTELQKRTGA